MNKYIAEFSNNILSLHRYSKRAIALIVLSLSVGLIHFISSSILIGKGKEWGNDVPLEPYEKSPTWLRLQKNNLQNFHVVNS